MHAEHGGRAEAVGDAAKDRTVAGVGAIRQVKDFAGQPQGAAAKGRVALAAKVERYCLAHPVTVQRRGCFRVDHRGEGTGCGTSLQKGGQECCRIPIGPCTGVVGIVGDDQWSVGRIEIPRLGCGLDRGQEGVGDSAASVPDAARQIAGDGRCPRLFPRIMCDQHGRAHLGDVGLGKTGVDRDGKDARLYLMRRRAGVEGGSCRNVGATCVSLVQHGHMDADRARMHLAPHCRIKQTTGVQPGGPHVDMRVSLVADKDLRLIHHRGRHHGVQVQRGRNRQIWPDDGAQAAEKLSLAVLAEGGNHRAVQAEKNAIQRRPMRCGGIADDPGDMVEGLARDRGTGVCMGRNAVRDAPTARAPGVKEPGEFVIHVAKAVDGSLAKVQHLVPEILERGLALFERAAFMHEGAGQDVERHGKDLSERVEAGDGMGGIVGKRGAFATAEVGCAWAAGSEGAAGG